MRLHHTLIIGSVAVVALAGCSTSTSSPSESPVTPPETTSPSPTAPTASPTTTDVLPPIIVDGTSTGVNATVGDILDITIKNVAKVSTDDASILKVTQAHSDETAEFNASAEALAAGKATLTIETTDGKTTKVTVTVTE